MDYKAIKHRSMDYKASKIRVWITKGMDYKANKHRTVSKKQGTHIKNFLYKTKPISSIFVCTTISSLWEKDKQGSQRGWRGG